MTDEIAIVSWSDVAARADVVEGLRRIFFEASGRKLFPSEAARDDFYQQWLGSYLENDAKFAKIALSREGGVAGYVVASATDPARSERFATLTYLRSISDLTRETPAHLHINIDRDWRGRGLGSRLVNAVAETLGRSGASGVHVVTEADHRNIGFYVRNGFEPRASVRWGLRRLLFLVRELPERDAQTRQTLR